MYRSGRLRDTNTNMNKIGLVHFWVRIWFWAASAKKEKESNPSFHTNVHASRKKTKFASASLKNDNPDVTALFEKNKIKQSRFERRIVGFGVKESC